MAAQTAAKSRPWPDVNRPITFSSTTTRAPRPSAANPCISRQNPQKAPDRPASKPPRAPARLTS